MDSEVISQKFLTVLKNVLGENPKNIYTQQLDFPQGTSERVEISNSKSIPLHEPHFIGNEWNLVKDCLDSGWVSSVGKYVDEFEKLLTEFTGAKYAVAVVNGTSALHLSLLLAGVQMHDEVLMPSLSFVATANAISYCGAVPHFVDSSQTTFGIDIDKLIQHCKENLIIRDSLLYNPLTERRIKAIVPVHIFGHPCDIAGIMEIAAQYKLTVIEDAAESLGSFYFGQHTGTFGTLGVLSFNGNKIITTGGGGAILTNDSQLAKKAKHLSTTGKRPHPWEFHHDELAFNYRLPNINAALGCAQMEQLPQFIANKRKLAVRYMEEFSKVKENFAFVMEPENCQSNYWLNAIKIVQANRSLRNEILAAASKAGYGCRPAWQLLHSLPMYEFCPRADLSNAQLLEDSLLNLPSSAKLVNKS